MSVDADLATLREHRDWHGRYPADDPFTPALDRVEAELAALEARATQAEAALAAALDRESGTSDAADDLRAVAARLREERDAYVRAMDTWEAREQKQHERAEAAERALAEIEAKPYRAEEVIARWRGRA